MTGFIGIAIGGMLFALGMAIEPWSADGPVKKGSKKERAEARAADERAIREQEQRRADRARTTTTAEEQTTTN